MAASLPRRIGRYEVRKELGRGTMGMVYEALDPSLDRVVALKVISLALAVSPGERESFEKRFLAEARIAGRLSHPGLVVVHDVGRDEASGTLFIALERLQGRTLAERLEEDERLDWREALRIVERVARALYYAHARGVVHRDIKPANIMLLTSGEPKVMDFGLAKHLLAGHELTHSGQHVGTPLFMAPEQVLGEGVDGRTDLFSLGSVLFTMLTGKRAFAGDSVPQIMARVAHQDPPAPSELVPGLPAELDYVVKRALAKSPDDRYRNGQVLAEDAEDILAGLPPRHRAGWTPPALGEGTAVSRGGGSVVSDVGLEPIEEAVASAPARTRPLRAVMIGFVLGGVAVIALSAVWPDGFAELVQGWPFLDRPPTSPRSSRAIATSEPSASLPASREAPPVSRPEAEAPATPIPQPPSPKPSLPPPVPRKSPVPAKAPGQLAVYMEHHLKSGTVRLFLDGKLVLEDKLDSRVSKKLPFLTLRKGVFQETLGVSPGRHEILVRVSWEDKEKARRLWGTFKAGQTRWLKIGISRLGGDLSLEWT